jgi:hypothetical protein
MASNDAAVHVQPAYGPADPVARSKRAILAPTNQQVDAFNRTILIPTYSQMSEEISETETPGVEPRAPRRVNPLNTMASVSVIADLILGKEMSEQM